MILTKQSLLLRKKQVLPIELGLIGSYDDLNKCLSNLSVHGINLVSLFKQKLLCLFAYPSFMVGTEPGTLHMFGKHFNTELFPIP